jgi:hypothetical protein
MVLAFLLATLFVGPAAMAHSPVVDADLSDWCLGAESNSFQAGGRTEDSSTTLVCGRCSVTTNQACEINSDCPTGQSCVSLTSKEELVWWDNRTDGAVNDLATIAMTQDNTNLYIAAELWVDPDPVSLPFGEVAIDYTPGGLNTWYDPNQALEAAGHCSVFTDRACTSDEDCHFCQISTEPTGNPPRVRTCGSGCDPDIGDVCEMDQVCVDLGAGGKTPNVGLASSPALAADYVVLFDFSRWLIGLDDSTQLREPQAGAWAPIGVFTPAVNPGASGGSGGPPGSVEVAIPWSAFGCTGCPTACSCPGFGPGQDYRFTMVIARGTSTLDYTPDGAIEDVFSEAVAGTTTTTTNSCPGFGIDNTTCEIADTSSDAFVPGPGPAVPGGESLGLRVTKDAVPAITITWDPSCSTADTDYALYEGELGNWYSHLPVGGLCSTGGATSATFTPAAGDRYYLAVPTDGATEGSYGEDSNMNERPASTSPCFPQSLGTCP